MIRITGKRNIVEINSNYVLKISAKFESVRPKRLMVEKFAIEKLNKYGLSVPKVISYGTFIDNREFLKLQLISGKRVSLKDSSIDIFGIYEKVGIQFKKIPAEFKRFGWINPNTLKGEFTTWNEYLYAFVEKYGLRLCKQGLFAKSQIQIVLKYITKLPNILSRASLVHRDLKPQNIIFNPQNKKVYVCDWENAIFGDPLFDAAVLRANFKNPQIFNGFIKGYVGKSLSLRKQAIIDLYLIIAQIGILDFSLQNNMTLHGARELKKKIGEIENT